MRKFFWEIVHKIPWTREEVKFPATEVYTDSSAANAIALNKQVSARIKHIPLKFQYVKSAIASDEIEILSIPTKDNTADILKKIVNLSTLAHLSTLIGLYRY